MDGLGSQLKEVKHVLEEVKEERKVVFSSCVMKYMVIPFLVLTSDSFPPLTKLEGRAAVAEK